MTPVMPPMVNRNRNESAYSMGVVSHTLPLYIVQTQLKILIPDGMPIRNVITENATEDTGLWPLVNMWWPHTMKPSSAIATDDSATARYPYTRCRLNVPINSEVIPKAGRIMM